MSGPKHGRDAASTLADCLLERLPMDEIYGAHNILGVPAGHFATRVGGMMASEGNFVIRITGRGGQCRSATHGDRLTGNRCGIVPALQTVVVRSVDPTHSAVVCARMDKPKAVAAAVHKLARLICAMLTKGEEYTNQGQEYFEERYRQRVLLNLKRRPQQLGMKVVPDVPAAAAAT